MTVLFASFASRSPEALSIHGFGILPLYFQTIGFIFFANALYITMILAFSASTKSRRYAGISFFLFVLFSEAIAEILAQLAGARFELLSVQGNLTSILNAILTPEGFISIFGPSSVGNSLLTNFIIIVGLIVGFSAVLTYQVLNKKI